MMMIGFNRAPITTYMSPKESVFVYSVYRVVCVVCYMYVRKEMTKSGAGT